MGKTENWHLSASIPSSGALARHPNLSSWELNLPIQEVYTPWRQDSPVEHKLHPAQQGRKQSQARSVPSPGPSGLGEDRGNGFLAALG